MKTKELNIQIQTDACLKLSKDVKTPVLQHLLEHQIGF